MPAPVLTLTDLSCDSFEALIQSMGEPSFRAKQVRKWIYQNLASTYEDMTDLPKELRQKLTSETRLHSLEELQKTTGADGTVKVLFQSFDGNTLEAALMYYSGGGKKDRRTVCVSTQAGCMVGCPFCATGRHGFQRNLTAGEIIDQVLYFARLLKEQQNKADDSRTEHVSNIVFMGMGEPLANYDNLWQAVQTLNNPDCFKLGARSMTISTAGLVPGIKRLMGEKMQVGLAVSLHAANNTLRNRLVPLNKKYPLDILIPVCKEYSQVSGRRLSFEYILFKGINDSPEQALELADLLRGFRCHVNLIPANQTEDTSYTPSPKRTVLAFENELKKQHVNVTLRESRGRDIEAGCGQLRSRYSESTGKKTKGGY